MSLGIMAYNEEANIGRLLSRVMRENFKSCRLKEIIVVASGCTDGTESVVRSALQGDQRIELLVQPRREGKASAINLFLSTAKGDILILESADTLPAKGTLERLIEPFDDPRVGMTGGRPVPVNTNASFVGFAVNLMWRLHHEVSLSTPKLGELVAFRNLVKSIPMDTAVDEASIEAIIRKEGYVLQYVPEAVVNNKGPENVRDFMMQRRRIAAGHKRLARVQNYTVSTTDPFGILRVLLSLHDWKLKSTIWTLGTIGLELTGRILGYFDFHVRKKNPYIWETAGSTKSWD